MLKLGEYQTLEVKQVTPQGMFLFNAEGDAVLLPTREIKAPLELGHSIQVFVYLDSDDFVCATLAKPFLTRGQFATLKVVDVTSVGAFLDWGLPKQLLLPFAEQPHRVKLGEEVTVCLYEDNSGRLAASARLERYLDNAAVRFQPGEAVDLIIWRKTQLGYAVIVNHKALGLLHDVDVFQHIKLGSQRSGFVKCQRPDDLKIDVLLEKPGFAKVTLLHDRILEYLLQHEGFCPLNDKSSPEEIQQLFMTSKKSFKMALGGLLKEKKITQTPEGIYLS